MGISVPSLPVRWQRIALEVRILSRTNVQCMSGALDNLPAVRRTSSMADADERSAAVEGEAHRERRIGSRSARQPPADLSGRLTEIARGYQRVLERNPAQPAALVGMSLVALASRQTEAAVKMARPQWLPRRRWCAAWVALGQALKAAARHEEAAKAYEQAIRLDGMNALARLGLGELKIAGRPAGRSCRGVRAGAQAPARRWLRRIWGWAMRWRCWDGMRRRWREYEAALALRPRLAEGEFAAGFALARLGRVKGSRDALPARRCCAAGLCRGLDEPGQPAARAGAGRVCRSRAAPRASSCGRTWFRAGSTWRFWSASVAGRKRPRRYLRKAFALNPAQVETLVAWCQFRVAEQDLAGAWAWLRWALARNPDFDEAVNMHGILLHLEGRFAEAVEVFERAEALGNRAAASNRGNSLLDLGRMEEALTAHEAAVERDPSSAGAMYNLALTQLRLGDWERGWPDTRRAGDSARCIARREFSSSRAGRARACMAERVLLHAEQGLGDTIQFCRYAALVAARGGVPILQVQPAAERLMRSLAVVRAGLAETAVLGADPEFDLECPLLSLPAVFRTSIDTVPWEGAYLGADAGTRRGEARAVSRRPILRPEMACASGWRGRAIRATRPTARVPCGWQRCCRCSAPSMRHGSRCRRARRRSNWRACPAMFAFGTDRAASGIWPRRRRWLRASTW